MFLYSIWDEVCKNISKSSKTITLNQVLSQKNNKWIAIKHDVETNVQKALDLAKIEAKYNIQATYYVQADLLDDNYKLLQEIASLGHEVTYHYDVLDANNGNFDKAIEEFKHNIEKFQKYGFEVLTVCPHGNPVMIRNGWNSNKDFFRDMKVVELFSNILDIVIELPKKLDYKYMYISDTGYGWKQIVNIKDNDIQNNGDVSIKDYKKLLEIINTQESVILSTHPHRWEKSIFKYMFNVYLFKILRFLARTISSVPILKKIISKYYYLAKKI
jgi:tetratricopeptide (TPR) repeat protein